MSPTPLPLDQLNALPEREFTAHFAGVLEHSPHYAEQVARARQPGLCTSMFSELGLGLGHAASDSGCLRHKEPE